MSRLLMLGALLSLAVNAAPAKPLTLTGVDTYEEFSDQQNQIGTHVFVLHLDRAVRNRGGFLVAPGLRLPVLATVGGSAAYDAPTTQLEVREWDTKYATGFGEDTAAREATLKALVGKRVKLELESCPKEYHSNVAAVIDANHPYERRASFTQMILKISSPMPHRTNGDVRTTAVVNGQLHYLYFFLYPRADKAPTTHIYLKNDAFFFPLKEKELAGALVGRHIAIEASGGSPWTPLPNPFP